LAFPFSLGAQTNECLAKLGPGVFTRVPVLIDTKPEDAAAEALLPAADILTQILAESIRKRLGSETGPLPVGDSVVSWRELGGAVIVTALRDGTFTWRRDTTVYASFMGTKGLDILDRALKESRDGGERVFWPDGAKGDSLSFRLSFQSPSVRQGGKLEQLQVRVANPVFSLMMPWLTPAEMSKKPRIDYPIKSQTASYEGHVILDFVVDTVGHINPASVHEVLAPGVKRPTGDLGRYYTAFLAATTRGLPTGEFKPATVAGCPINQQVRQTFDFKLDQ